jgi:ribonucleoside-diphosphate reductase alpha chain
MGTLTLHDAPHMNTKRCKASGFTDAELEKSKPLPGAIRDLLRLQPLVAGRRNAVMARLNIPESEWQAPDFNLLRKLGFTKKQIDEANDVICGRGTVEGAPHLKDEHYPSSTAPTSAASTASASSPSKATSA